MSAPTDRDIQIDKLLATSRAWLRVQEAIVRVLLKYPNVAREVVAELRKVAL